MSKAKRLIMIMLVLASCTPHVKESSNAEGPFLLSGAWQMKRVSELSEKGDHISQPAYDAASWSPAEVPGTVLHNLVKNGDLPEPYFGQNNRRSNHLIPDIAEAGKAYYHYWFRKEFEVPAVQQGENIWLQFDGINYIGHIWLNGHPVGETKGMFVQKKFNVTPYIHREGKNVLAVSVEPVEFPGDMQERMKENVVVNENRNGGDGEIGKNVTMLMSAGWDFTFHDGIRDRNTGIWRDVKLFASGPVTLEKPFVKSQLSLPNLERAEEVISITCSNATDQDQKAKITLRIAEADIFIQKEITLKAGAPQQLQFTSAEFPELIIHHPKVWWPIHKGEQPLYTLEAKVEVGGEVSDQIKTRFGIRDIRTDRNTSDTSRIFYINGKRLFIRGANWIPEAMLRTSKKRTYAQLRYTQQAGVNMLRLWGGGISESDEFFELCDEMGFLVWHEFWMTGDTKPPKDSDLYFENVRSTIERIRNHPSLAYYVSSNEQDDILDIKPLLTELDGTRGYQFQSECCGVHDGSPYKYENPMQYYDNTASDRGSRIDGFCPEYGTASLPTVEALREMMPEEDLWPINKETWDYLDGNAFHNMTTKYDAAVKQYGDPKNIDEYVQNGQLVGAVAYRSIWENWNYNKYDFGDRFASGVLFWYHNSPVRQVCSRMWDWSLEPTAALYFAQDALEPLHAQFDFIKNTVSVNNDYYRAFKNLKVRCRVLDMEMNTLADEFAMIDLPEDAVANDVIKVALSDLKLTPVHFIKLEIFEGDSLLSDTFYWRSTDTYHGPWTVGGPIHGGFETLQNLKTVELEMETLMSEKDGRKFLKVKLINHDSGLAFFNRLKVVNKDDQSLVRPVFYSDNYFSLLPGESKMVEIDLSMADIQEVGAEIVLEGFNTHKHFVSID